MGRRFYENIAVLKNVFSTPELILRLACLVYHVFDQSFQVIVFSFCLNFTYPAWRPPLECAGQWKSGVTLTLQLMGLLIQEMNKTSRKCLVWYFLKKLVFSNNTFQTMQPNDILTLLCSGGESFKVCKKEKSSDNTAQSCLVTSSGFKPETFPTIVGMLYSFELRP